MPKVGRPKKIMLNNPQSTIVVENVKRKRGRPKKILAKGEGVKNLYNKFVGGIESIKEKLKGKKYITRAKKFIDENPLLTTAYDVYIPQSAKNLVNKGIDLGYGLNNLGTLSLLNTTGLWADSMNFFNDKYLNNQ